MHVWKRRSMRLAYLMGFIALLALIGTITLPTVLPQTTTKTATLPNFNVEFNFPSEGNPGDNVVLSIKAVARENVRLGELTIHVYAYAGHGEQRTILVDTIAEDGRVKNGETFHRSYTATLPTDIPRSPLMATVHETARTYRTAYTSYYTWWYPPYWNYSWTGWPYWGVPYRYTYSSEQTTFTSVPLTYVKATTPEYEKLRSDYDLLSESYSDLQSDYEKSQEEYNSLKTEYESLKAEHQTALSEGTSLRAELASIKAQLAETRDLMYVFAITTAALAAITLLVALIPGRASRSPKPIS